MGSSKHKPNLSESSTSSSENETASRASSSGHAQASSSQQQQPSMSRWERLRRPSAASSSKRPNFSEVSRTNSAHSSAVTSPTSTFFPLPSPIGGPSQGMLRTASDDSYMHILAASAAAKRAALESEGATSDAASIMSFTCSLSKEFDRQRTEVDTLNASRTDLAGSAAKSQPQTEKGQAWLDTTFNKLSARYRAPKKNANPKASARPIKPHFLDLSSVICPTPAPVDPVTASTEDESEAGDRTSSSSSSFNSGPDSSFEAMSGWDNSSADTSIELRTPQNEEDRQLTCSAYDLTTPRPSQLQRFASAQSTATSKWELMLPSPPRLSPLMPNFNLPTSNASTPGLAPPSANQYGFAVPPPMIRGVTVDDIHHKPSSVAMTSNNSASLAPSGPSAGMRQLRKQKSFDNPAELRRRQKQEWIIGGPMPPGFGGNPGLTIGIPKPQHFNHPSGNGLLSPQSAMSSHTLDPRRQRSGMQLRSPSGGHAMLPPQEPIHLRIAEMSRPSAMQRGLSHDAAGASLQHHNVASMSPPQRPGLVPRASSGALRTLGPLVSDIDPSSTTGFSSSSRPNHYTRPGSDRRMLITSPLHSPVGGSVPLPPLLPASSRGSYGSSVGTESLPPTPMSATFMRNLPFSSRDERIKPTPSSPREVRTPRDLHHNNTLQHSAAPMMGSALGLMPGQMVRAYSDAPYSFLSEEASRVHTGSRLRGESVSSHDSDTIDAHGGVPIRSMYATQTTPRQKIRPELRREHTSNAIMVSPPKPKPQPLEYLTAPVGEIAGPSTAASASITPRSSSLKDLIAAGAGVEGLEERARLRASLDSDNGSDSSLAYTKPSPLLVQGLVETRVSTVGGGSDAESLSSNAITPTNSYHTNLVATPTNANGGSKWSPDNSPTNHRKAATTTSGFQGARQRANSRADEWAANLRKLTTRGPAAAGASK
ncbi:uncharacterized protein MEPE_03640 [Melanopsichium pennsylvanicum]|uniref:Uncharacterized protein n=2 Tax=Melanopsichium pennsylvanicum TaxID=63383 RepID=A0AAJ5C5N8_9BASI|nr:hypothetical protein BN887_04549 [Melanopsichium pennsylvanicum 4]SNX84931.1 uncharacterized protein MEPE_03640 [Melanopsichium pennsylvanicum]